MIRPLFAFLLLALIPGAALADDDHSREDAAIERAAQLQDVMLGTVPAEKIFTPEFLSAVPAAQLLAITKQLVETHGPFLSVDQISYKGDGMVALELVFEKARVAANFQLADKAPYLIAGFRIGTASRIDDTPQKIIADLGALPGSTHLGVYLIDGSQLQPVLTSEPAKSLAVGSAFKLWVLSALAQDIKAGKRSWRDIVPLDAPSAPTGKLRDWPVGSPLTLHTLAALMISESDNTATDVLMRLLGRDAISAELRASGHTQPARTLPLLTTVEAFSLKSGDLARVETYAVATPAVRATLLDEWKDTLTADRVDPGKGAWTPNLIDRIEWFASAEDIARILVRLRDLDDPQVPGILAINPGLGPDEAQKWAFMGYKGGSETGVLNLSWLLRDGQGRWFVVVISWNNPQAAVDTPQLIDLAQRIMGILHQ